MRPGYQEFIPNEHPADLPGMDTKKPIDTANEPVDYDDGIVDTGVLHEEDEDQDKKEQDERDD